MSGVTSITLSCYSQPCCFILPYCMVLHSQASGDHAPIFLRGPRDRLIYQGAMLFSLAGISLALFGLGRMATGTIQKKS